MAFIQLHGLVPADTPQTTDAPDHSLLPCGPVTAVVSPFPHPTAFENLTPEQLADWALKHNAILLAYCGADAVLPMAVGAIFSGATALRKEVAAHIDQHLKALGALHRIKEYTVQLLITGAAPNLPTQPATGRDFLLARRHQRDRRHSLRADQQSFAKETLAALNALAVQVDPAGAPKQDRLLNCAVLARQEDQPKLHQLARDLHAPARALGLDLVISGPWPPYSYDPGTLASKKAEHVDCA